jgi:hypothetical protein
MVPVNPPGPTGLPDDTAVRAEYTTDRAMNRQSISVSEVISGSTAGTGEEYIEPTYPDDAYQPVVIVEPTP